MFFFFSHQDIQAQGKCAVRSCHCGTQNVVEQELPTHLDEFSRTIWTGLGKISSFKDSLSRTWSSSSFKDNLEKSTPSRITLRGLGASALSKTTWKNQFLQGQLGQDLELQLLQGQPGSFIPQFFQLATLFSWSYW